MPSFKRLGWSSLIASLLLTSCLTAPQRVTPTANVTPRPTAIATRATSTPLPARAVLPSATLAPTATPDARAFELQAAFVAASKEFGVPESILLAVAYNESRWEQHDGQPNTDGGYGIMNLIDVQAPADVDQSGAAADPIDSPESSDRSQHTLLVAARLIGQSPEALKRDPVQNVRGGAALLAQYARETTGAAPASEADWYGAVARYRGTDEANVARDFADTVFATIRTGASRVTTQGQVMTLPAKNVTPNTGTATFLLPAASQAAVAGCPSGLVCDFIPAYARNFNPANRPSNGIEITYIVIHDTEEPYANAIKTFQDPRSFASANYLIRSSDGHVTQLVPDKDVGHHAGNWYFNSHSIGIEHEGHAAQGATWFSEPLYQASAKLVRYLAEKYHVPLDRAHVIGHDNVPAQTPAGQSRMHWDPGPFWDWAHYMELLGAPLGTSGDSSTANVVMIRPSFATNSQTVRDCTTGGCHDLPAQPSNFVYLHTAPSPTAPLIADPALTRLQRPAGRGTTRIDDWGDRAVTGQSFYRVERQGDWDAIYFGGQKAWFYNPGHDTYTLAGSGTLVTPKSGRASIPVYGVAFPEPAAYPSGMTAAPIVPLQYSIPAGQIYVATDLVSADYFNPRASLASSLRAVVKGVTKYYQIFFSYRLAFVRADDVDVVKK